MRRLLVLVWGIVLVDTLLYAALTPLLPEFSERFGLSKGAAGALVAVYAVGLLVGAVPAGLAAARLGPKRSALAGLAVVGGASIVFALAGDAQTLGAARFGQGIGSAFSWAGGLAWLVAATPRERRGELLGTTLGVAIFGALLGPVVGAVAAEIGTAPTFSAVGGVALLVALSGARVPGVPAETLSLGALRTAFVERRFLAGLWLMVLPALLFGILHVLGSLEFANLGWGPRAIGAVFFATAAVETVVAPLVGRLVDRRGAMLPVRAALTGGIAVALGIGWAANPFLLAGLALLASVTWGALFTPGMTLLSSGAERAGLSQALAFGLMNAAWATGAMIGPTVGGALGEALGDPVAFGLGALACALTLAVVLAGASVGTLASRVPTRP